MKNILLTLFAAVAMTSCGKNDDSYDASGTFEAVETIVPAEANGLIMAFDLSEGQTLKAGQTVGYIDTVQLSLQKQQLEAQAHATESRKPDIAAELAALEEDLKQAIREQERTARLVAADAATRKQLDDAQSHVAVLKKKIAAQRTSLTHAMTSLDAEAKSVQAKIAQVDDQLRRSGIVNRAAGTVITKYAEVNEMASAGKPLYKIADLDHIILRAYITGDQIGQVKIGQPVGVFVDRDADGYKRYPGTVEWISDKAEFTPKTIQTKDERANLVYAVKVRVRNDGMLKIGMYGEIKF